MKSAVAVILLVAYAQALDLSKLKPVEVKLPPLYPKLTAAEWIKVWKNQDTTPIRHPSYKEGTKQQPASSGLTFVPHQSRIVGGQFAQPGQFPWQAFLIMDQSYVCGGSLISPDWVMSAGHCGHGHYDFVVNLGKTNLNYQEPGEIIMSTSYVIVHEGFDPNMLHNDISLVRLPQQVQASATINYIRLPPPSLASVNLDGQMVTISGFGKYTDEGGISQELRYVTLPVMPNAQCAGAFPGVDGSQICTDTTGGHSACNGDSGGPLIIQLNDGNYYEVGLVSFGSTQGCTLGIPAVFTRITSFLPWIESQTGLRIPK